MGYPRYDEIYLRCDILKMRYTGDDCNDLASLRFTTSLPLPLYHYLFTTASLSLPLYHYTVITTPLSLHRISQTQVSLKDRSMPGQMLLPATRFRQQQGLSMILIQTLWGRLPIRMLAQAMVIVSLLALRSAYCQESSDGKLLVFEEDFEKGIDFYFEKINMLPLFTFETRHHFLFFVRKNKQTNLFVLGLFSLSLIF